MVLSEMLWFSRLEENLWGSFVVGQSTEGGFPNGVQCRSQKGHLPTSILPVSGAQLAGFSRVEAKLMGTG